MNIHHKHDIGLKCPKSIPVHIRIFLFRYFGARWESIRHRYGCYRCREKNVTDACNWGMLSERFEMF